MQKPNIQNIILLCIAIIIKVLHLDNIHVLAKVLFVLIIILLSKNFYPFAIGLAFIHILFYNKNRETFMKQYNDDKTMCPSNTIDEEGNCITMYNDDDEYDEYGDEYDEYGDEYDDDQEFPIKEEEEVVKNVDFSDMAIGDDGSFKEKTVYDGEEGDMRLAEKLGIDEGEMSHLTEEEKESALIKLEDDKRREKEEEEEKILQEQEEQEQQEESDVIIQKSEKKDEGDTTRDFRERQIVIGFNIKDIYKKFTSLFLE